MNYFYLKMRVSSLFLFAILSAMTSFGQTFSNTVRSNCDTWNTNNAWATALEKTITVTGLPNISSTTSCGVSTGTVLRQVNLQLGSASCKGNLSSYYARLITPTNDTIVLFNAFGTGTSAWMNLALRDDPSLERLKDYSSPGFYFPWSVGYYRTENANAFSVLNGKSPNGNWRLQIVEATATEVSFEKIDLVFGLPVNVNDVTASTANNECASATCMDATKVIRGTNNGYSGSDANSPGNIINGCDWNNANNNSAWFSFVASGSTAYITVSGMLGTGTGRMQPIVVVAPSTCSTPTIVPTGGCPDDESTNNRSYLAANGGGIATAGNVYSNGISLNTEFNLSNLVPGQKYYLYIDGDGNAASTFYIELTGGVQACTSGAITLTSSITQPTCGNTNGSITVTPSPAGAYTYTWNPNVSTTATASSLLAGTYNVTVSNGVLCSATTTFVLTNSSPTVTITGNNVVCGTQMVTLSATSGFTTYNWTTPTGSASGATVSTSTPGFYSVTATNTLGCSATASFSLSSFAVSAPADVTICPGQSVQLNAASNEPTSFTWSPSTGLNNANIQSPIASPIASTTYTVTGQRLTDNLVLNGDFSLGNTGFTTSYVPGSGGTFGLLSQEGQFAISTSPSNTHTSFCVGTDHTSGNGNMLIANGSSVPNTTVWCQNITVSPNVNYLFSAWASSVDPGNPALLQFSINSVQLGTSVQLPATTCVWQQFTTQWNSGANTSAQICILSQNIQAGGNDFALDDITFTRLCQVSDDVVVTVAPSPIAAIAGPTSICQGSVATFDAGTGATSYLWSNGTTTRTATFNVAGTYSVTVTNGSGCTASASVVLTINSAASPSISGNLQVCAGSNTTLSVSNFTSFLWSNGANTQSITVPAGTYSVTITNSLGCTATNTVTVTPVPGLTLTNTAANPTCNGGTNGSIDLSVAGGTAPYTYQWSNAATSQDLLNLSAGVYSVTVSNTGNTCTSTRSITITQPTAITITAAATSASCSSATGTINVTVSGGTTPYTYNWGGGVTTEDRTGLAAGTYTVTVTDNNSCTASFSTTVNNQTNLTVTSTSNNPTCNGSANGSITTTVSGGTQPYTFNWGGGVITQNRNSLVAGTYNVTVSDVNGCNASASAILVNPTPLQINITPSSNTTLCIGQSVTLTTAGAATYLWSNGGTNASITVNPLVSTNYEVVATDVRGCIGTANYAVTVSPNPTITIANSGTAAICNGDSRTLTASGANTYRWSTGATTLSIGVSPQQATTYQVTGTNAFGCTASAETNFLVTTVVANAGNNQTITLGGSAALVGTYQPTGAALNWSNGGTNLSSTNSLNVTPTATTTYQFNVVSNGCSANASVTVVVLIPAAIVKLPNFFSPNADNQNDALYPVVTSGNIVMTDFKIYNRWGQVVYNKLSPWDGTINGELQPRDTYIVKAIYKEANGNEVMLTGDVALIR
jgi:gliding motility-associated-like protein